MLAADSSSTCGNLFEAYVRLIFGTTEALFGTTTVCVRCRKCCGKSSMDYADLFVRKLGGCTGIQRTTDIIGDCKKEPEGTVF
jgi:hypothetical protein